MTVLDAESLLGELERKNGPALERLAGGYTALLVKEAASPAELLRLELKNAVESTEISALWLADTDDLDFKLSLAAQCGDGAAQYRLVKERLQALAVDLSSHDPRHGGYSKLFAFLRSLQTTEERASAGLLTGKSIAAARDRAVAAYCREQGDEETATLYRDFLAEQELRHSLAGHEALRRTATSEESQARARRAAYRAVELLGDMQEPTVLRKLLGRQKK